MFLPYLNATGAVFGPVADSLPSCYAFTYAVYEYELARFMTFESSWGNFSWDRFFCLLVWLYILMEFRLLIRAVMKSAIALSYVSA